jgi:hypothetical protein
MESSVVGALGVRHPTAERISPFGSTGEGPREQLVLAVACGYPDRAVVSTVPEEDT